MEIWEYGLLVVFTIIDVTAIVLNSSVILVITKTPQLRYKLTNSFILNLCITDLICAISLVPTWIVNFAAGRWVYSECMCDIYGFGYAILSYETIWTICLITAERYYSIAYPMLHAANMTLSRTFVTIASSWLFSCLLAAFPPIYDQNRIEVYHIEGRICVNTFADNVEDNLQWIIISVIGFCIPAVIVMLFYLAIFRIARQAQRQVNPSSLGTSETSTSLASKRHSRRSPKENFQGLSDTNENSDSLTNSRSFSKELLPKVGHILKVGKAARTVLAVSGLFLCFWLPHFVVLFYGSTHFAIPHRELIESVVTWLTFLTFVANPTLYGICNRSIRQELLQALPKFQNQPSRPSPESSSPSEDMDFLQFLERTSSPETSISKHNSSTAANNERY